MREMRDSGVEWINDIPSTWRIDRLKNHLRRTDIRNPGGKQVLSLYRELGIVPKNSRDDNHNVTSEDTSNYKYVQPGDFVINKMKAWQGSVAVSDYEGIVSPAYYVYRFTDDSFNNRYFHYLLRGCYKDEFMRLSAGIRIGQWDLPSAELDNVPVLIPELKVQQHIVTYLDAKCAKIDAVIERQRASIEKLKAYKLAVITEAVISSTSSMRVKLKQVCKFINGDRSSNYPSSDEFVNEGIPFLGADALVGRYVDCSQAKRISREKYRSMGGAKIQKGDILYTLRGSTIGKNALATFDEGTVASSLMVIRSVGISPEFLMYWLNSEAERQQRQSFINGSTAPNLSAENVGTFFLNLPSTDEQRHIVEYLDRKCGRIEEAIQKKEMIIDKLSAYKKSLIYEVVTGKKEV